MDEGTVKRTGQRQEKAMPQTGLREWLFSSMNLCQSRRFFEARRLRIALSTAPVALSQWRPQLCRDVALRPKQTPRRSRWTQALLPDTDACVQLLEASLLESRPEQVRPM